MANSFEINGAKDLGDAKLNEFDGKFSQLAEQINHYTEHPLYQEFQHVSNQAQSIIGRMSAMIRMPGAMPLYEQLATQLGQLHEKAVGIRAKMVADNMGRAFNVAPGATLEGTLEKQLDSIIDTSPTLFGKLKKPALDIIKGVSGTAETLAEGRANRYFLKTRNGNIGVNFDTVNSDMKFVKQLRETNNPQMNALADQLEKGIQQVAAADPFGRAARNEWMEQNFGSTFNTRPLKIMGGLLAGVVTTFGAAQTIFSKDHKLSPATVGWGVAFLGAMGMFQSGKSKALDFIASVGSPDAARFAPAFNKQSFTELQEIATNKSKELKALQKTDQPVTTAQVEQLTGNNPNSALAQTLAQIPETERASALINFGRKMDIGQRELLENMFDGKVA